MTDLIDTHIFILSHEQSVNLYVYFGGSGIWIVATWIWLVKASKLMEPKSPLKRAWGLMITLLIPSRDIHVCDAFHRKGGYLLPLSLPGHSDTGQPSHGRKIGKESLRSADQLHPYHFWGYDSSITHMGAHWWKQKKPLAVKS